MWKLIQLLIFGHCHKWKIIKEADVDGSFDQRWTRYYTQCEICGKIKVFDQP